MENNREKVKEKINKILNNKYFDVVLIIFINIIFFLVCNILFTPRYEQVDDFIIMTLISKADGMYTVYGVQIHPIICAIIILLYKTGININWYTIFMLVMQFISFTIIGTIFIKKNKTLGIPIYIAFILMIYTKMLRYIQYTTVSTVCITSGFLLLIHYMHNASKITSKSTLILANIMIAIGSMIRFSTLLIVAPFAIIYFILKFIKDKDFKLIKIGCVIILIVLLVNISFNIIYNINPTYKEFLKFHDARTYLHDYNKVGYYEYQELFDSIGWSGNDRDTFYGYLYGDEETYSIENLEKIKEGVLQEKDYTDLYTKIKNTLIDFINSIKKDYYKYTFLLSVMLLIFNNIFIITKNLKDKSENREDKIKFGYINLIFATIVLMHCLFIFLDRPMFRVVISSYILGLTMLIYEFLENFNLNKIFKYIFVISILVVSILEFKEKVEEKYYKEDYDVYKEIIEYTSSHKENAYLYTISMHDRFLAYSIYEKIQDGEFSNLRALGDWDMYTENYYYFKEIYNIDNLMKSLTQKDNVYLISANMIWKEDIEIIKEYIKENYDIDVKEEIVKEFKYDIKIYKLKEK